MTAGYALLTGQRIDFLVLVFITRVTYVPKFTSLNMYVVAVLATIQIVV